MGTSQGARRQAVAFRQHHRLRGQGHQAVDDEGEAVRWAGPTTVARTGGVRVQGRRSVPPLPNLSDHCVQLRPQLRAEVRLLEELSEFA